VAGGRIDILTRRGRNDARRGGAAEAEGIAHRDDPVADPRLGRFLEGDEREVRAFNLDDREVRAFIAPDDAGLQLAFVREPDRDLGGVLDDVVVGDDVAVGRNEEARTRAQRGRALAVVALRLLSLGTGTAEP